MSLDGIPYIGKHHRGRDGLYVATGFNKWGMTGSMASALILRDIITGKENEWENLCSPSRFMGKKQLFVNMGNSIAHLLSPGKRCTHMGCALNWNAAVSYTHLMIRLHFSFFCYRCIFFDRRNKGIFVNCFFFSQSI